MLLRKLLRGTFHPPAQRVPTQVLPREARLARIRGPFRGEESVAGPAGARPVGAVVRAQCAEQTPEIMSPLRKRLAQFEQILEHS
jgi:hypothetical protein